LDGDVKPNCRPFLIRTQHATYQFMRMDWGDGEPIVMLQIDVPFAPPVPILPKAR